MASRKKGGQQKPAKPTLVYNEKEVPEGSALHTAFTRLSGLTERELAGASALLEMLLSSAASARKLVQMQAQLDRIEGRIVELTKGTSRPAAPEKADEPAAAPKAPPARGKRSRKPTAATRELVAGELAALEESVEERQARMAKMEMDEKYKRIAQVKKQEMLKSKKSDETQTAAETEEKAESGEKKAPKKKPRRRRKPAKKPSEETASGSA